MKRLLLLTSAIALSQAVALQGRTISDYIEWGPTSHNFPQALKDWQPGTPLTADDNFFISRVKPRARFTNMATQVHQYLTPETDKNLIYWVPIGTPPDNALPSGNFDSDMFSMWSYVTHFGNWSTSMARIPGNFSDAAHRNGVGVSPVLGIPWGQISADWSLTLRQMIDVGPEKMSDFLEYYGIDGLGYNSEFSLNTGIAEDKRPKNVNEISAFNAALVRIAGEKGRNGFMNIWYDGTSDSGSILFDRGLASHNYNTFGDKENPASSLFFNYNWNSTSLMQKSVDNAKSMGRSPQDLYVGFNMQGGEPKKTMKSWSLLKDYPLSIGLWGAHSESMMYESRREFGATPLGIQRNYLNRTEWWFSGGSRNPANAPEISDTWNYSGENTGFFGMARLMSARSAITEPFVTNFNLGNGTFFNFKGERRSDTPWANIGMQDILPTWRFWWSNKLLGGDTADVPQSGLDASFVWDDAWLGGSSLKIAGTHAPSEFLHLFKTSVAVNENSTVFIRYKLVEGQVAARLALTAEGEESVEIKLPYFLDSTKFPSQEWKTAEFRLADLAPQLKGKKISLVALKFTGASNLDMRLGGFGIIDETAVAPATPIISRSELLAASTSGIDGKIIWEMPDGQTKRYNDDQGVSFFQLYYQLEGEEPVMQSGTSSWAGLILDAASGKASKSSKVRFGVASVGLDFMAQSEIAWGEWFELGSAYEMSHEIVSRLHSDPSKSSVTEVVPGTEVEYAFKDSNHPDASWHLMDADNNVASSSESSSSFVAKATAPGNYSLRVAYKDDKGMDMTDFYPNILCVIGNAVAMAPRITDFQYSAGDDTIECNFEAEEGSGIRSRALAMNGKPFGLKVSDLGLTGYKTWGMSFWLRPDAYFADETHLVSVRDKTQAWAKNEWGWLWSTIGKDGKGLNISIRKIGDTGSVEFHYDDVTITPGIWTAIGFSFAFDSSKKLTFGLYINGKKVEPNSYTDVYGDHDGSPEPFGQLYAFSKGNVVSVGGTLFKTGGVEGAIDNFSYWNSPLDEGRAALAMGDIDRNNPPEGMQAFYSFEKEAGNESAFINELESSSHPDAPAGRFHYVPQLNEGSGVLQFVDPDFCAGSPLLKGETPMDTEVKWIAPGADVSSDGNAAKGTATLKYKAGGFYKVTLRVENPCGYDEREINMINVPCLSSVEQITESAQLCRNKVVIAPNGLLAFNFDAPGEYVVEVVTLDGRMVRTETVRTDGSRHIIDNLPTQTPLIVTVR